MTSPATALLPFAATPRASGFLAQTTRPEPPSWDCADLFLPWHSLWETRGDAVSAAVSVPIAHHIAPEPNPPIPGLMDRICRRRRHTPTRVTPVLSHAAPRQFSRANHPYNPTPHPAGFATARGYFQGLRNHPPHATGWRDYAPPSDRPSP